MVTPRNMPDDVLRGLDARPTWLGRNHEDDGSLKLGSLLASIALEAGGLTAAEAKSFSFFRGQTSVAPSTIV